MIELTKGDILQADTEALVNTVNCVGVMGRGIALQFKNAYPLNYKEYKAACDRGEVQPGRMLVHERGTLTNPKYIINFPTKRHWKGKSRIEDIDDGLGALAKEIQQRGITSIAIPPLGSGLGGLPWKTVRACIEDKLSHLDNVEIRLYEPTNIKPLTMSKSVPPMTPGRAAMIKLMQEYLAALMDPFVTLLEIQKLMYFMQESGQELKLHYAKGPYGPYSPTLRHVLNALEGHYISGYGDGGDSPSKHLELVPGAIKDADDFLKKKNRKVTGDRLNRVVELVDGFETPFGLELLATTHWVLRHDNVQNDKELVNCVHKWHKKKEKFSSHQIIFAHKTLQAQGWLA